MTSHARSMWSYELGGHREGAPHLDSIIYTRVVKGSPLSTPTGHMAKTGERPGRKSGRREDDRISGTGIRTAGGRGWTIGIPGRDEAGRYLPGVGAWKRKGEVEAHLAGLRAIIVARTLQRIPPWNPLKRRRVGPLGSRARGAGARGDRA